MTDTRRYMIIVDFPYSDRENLEVWDYNLTKEEVPNRIQELKDYAFRESMDIESIQVCEHTAFIRVEV